jgi:hypothetical protein
MDPDPDPRGPKTCGSGGSGFGSQHWLLKLQLTPKLQDHIMYMIVPELDVRLDIH